MALTRKFLKALEIEGDKADQIIEAHTETVDGLKASLEQAQADAGNCPNSRSSWSRRKRTWRRQRKTPTR